MMYKDSNSKVSGLECYVVIFMGIRRGDSVNSIKLAN